MRAWCGKRCEWFEEERGKCCVNLVTRVSSRSVVGQSQGKIKGKARARKGQRKVKRARQGNAKRREAK